MKELSCHQDVDDQTGERIWGDMTTKNVNRPIAIVLDNLVYSAPNVINPITNGSSEISGNFNVQKRKTLPIF
jgi:SecD/SecF fusion protein